jgi:hypothetical protein
MKGQRQRFSVLRQYGIKVSGTPKKNKK